MRNRRSGPNGGCRAIRQKNLKHFDYYGALQPNASLGEVVELGAGLWTQALLMLRARPDVSANSITVVDPGIPSYLGSGLATYRRGTLRGVPVKLMPIGSEQVPACFSAKYDTVVMINVIEHTFNAFATLHAAYRLLKPGGLFIFAERIVKMDSYSQIFHPIRLKTAFFDNFLMQLYDEVYRFKGVTREVRVKAFLKNEIFFIGSKRAHPDRRISAA